MSEPQNPVNPPKFGCFWVGMLVLLVLALIGYGMCSNVHIDTR